MMIVLILIRTIIGPFETTRLYAFLEIMLYSFIGVLVYGILAIKTKILNDIFGKSFINKILNKLHLNQILKFSSSFTLATFQVCMTTCS